jgi:hypothetical protein
MDAVTVLYIFSALCLKHFVCDFPLQVAYQYRNKGTYGHPGGLLHAGIHTIGTLVALSALIHPLHLVLGVAIMDGVIHYHVDWAKMNLNAWYRLTPSNSEFFWHLLGLDQLFHYLTYIGIVWYLI